MDKDIPTGIFYKTHLPETGSFSRQFSFVRDDPDLILRLTFTEEGEA